MFSFVYNSLHSLRQWMESEFGLQRAVQSLGLDGPTHQTQNVNVSQTGRSLPLERAQAHSHVVLETDQSVECGHFIDENEFVGTAEGSNNNSFPDSSTHARVENVARQQTAVSRMTVCFQRLQRRHLYVSWMIRHRFASSVVPLSSVLATIFVFFILGCPTTNVLNEVSQEAILRVGISWLLFLTLIILMIHVLVIPLSSAVAAVYMLVSGTNSPPPPRQVQQTTRTMQVRPARKFGRQRRGASHYGTKSIGRIRTEAWGPTFRPSLPTITEERIFRPTLPTITEEPLGLPPLYPKELRPFHSSRCSQKRKMESAVEDERPAKRLKRSDATEEPFFVETPSDSGRHALVDPQTLILISDMDECSSVSDELDGDHYFTLPADELVSTSKVTSNVLTADDDISLTYSDCDDGDLDSELVGISIDLFIHDIVDSQCDISSLVGVPEDTVGSNSAGHIVWSDSLLSQEVPPFVSLPPRKRCRLNLSSTVSPVPKQDYVRICQEWIPGIGWRVVRPRRRFGHWRRVRNNARASPTTLQCTGKALVINSDDGPVSAVETVDFTVIPPMTCVTTSVSSSVEIPMLVSSDDSDLPIDVDLPPSIDNNSIRNNSNSAGHIVWSDSLLSQEVPPFVSLPPRKRRRLNLSSTVSPVPKQDFVRICQEWIPGIGWRVVRPRRRFGHWRRVRNNARASTTTLQCTGKACATISDNDGPVSAPEPVDFTVVPSAAHITSVLSSRLEVPMSVSSNDYELPIDVDPPTSIDDDDAGNSYFDASDSDPPPFPSPTTEPSTPTYSSPTPIRSSIPRSLPTAETTPTPNSSQTPIPPSSTPSTPTINNELGSVMVVLIDDSGNPLVPRVEVRRSRRIASLPPVDYRDMCNDNEGDDDEDYVDGS